MLEQGVSINRSHSPQKEGELDDMVMCSTLSHSCVHDVWQPQSYVGLITQQHLTKTLSVKLQNIT